jgi:hypothetical protein
LKEDSVEKESYDSKAEGTAIVDLHSSAIHKKMSEALGKSEKRDNNKIEEKITYT